MLTDDEIAEIIDRLARYARPQQILLFGSFAKDAARENSDLDLMVIMETNLRGSARSDALNALVSGYSVPVDVHVATPEEFEVLSQVEYSFLDSVRRTGRVVYRAPGRRSLREEPST